MPYVIKRYANRKLYDTRTKRYLTLDEVAVLVRAGEEISVEDADSGENLTSVVLARIIAEGNRKGNQLALPQRLLTDLIQRPGETVLGAVKTSVSAGQRAVEQAGSEVGKLFDTVKGAGGRGAHRVGEAGGELASALEERFSAMLAGLNLPTRAEMAVLQARIGRLEAKLAKATKGAPLKKAPARSSRATGSRVASARASKKS